MLMRHSLVFLLCASAFGGFAQTAEQSFSKSFHTDNKSHLQLYLPGAIDLQIWKNPSIRVEMGVTLPGASEAVVKGLANAGRYNLVSSSADSYLRIDAPNMQKQLRLKGQDVQESYRFTVYVPEGITVEMLPAASAKSVELASTVKPIH